MFAGEVLPGVGVYYFADCVFSDCAAMYLLHHLAFCLLLPSIRSQCPTGFDVLERGCYKVSRNPYAPSSHATSCVSDGGKLADLETQTEYNAVMEWMTSSKNKYFFSLYLYLHVYILTIVIYIFISKVNFHCICY